MYDEGDDVFGSENEEDDEDAEGTTDMKPTFVVIAIDTHPSMFVKKEDGSMPFRDSLEACYSLADSLIFASGRGKWSQFAVVLAKEDSPVLTEFGDNILNTVKLLKAKINQVPDKQLIDEYQRKGDFDLASFFLTCKKLFHDIKSPFYKRTFIYISDDDNPIQDGQKRFSALNEAKTFSGNQIDFQIIPTRRNFKYENFYNELFHVMNITPVEEICEDKNGLLQKLSSAVITRHTQTRIRFYPIKGDTDRFLQCFKLNVIQSRPILFTKVTKDGKMVKRVSKDDFSTFYFYKIPLLEDIKFDLLEYNSLLDHDMPKGLTLLYISKRLTEFGYVLGKSYLLRQDEKSNLPYFKKLWRICVDKERVLVCARKVRQYDKIKYVELLPVNVNSEPMFLANYPEQKTDEKQKEAIKKLVDDLTIDFDFKMIPDMGFRKKQAHIKSKLLDEPAEEINDGGLIAKDLDERLTEAVSMIRSSYCLVEEKKRKATGGTSRSKK
ncbi:hypothetical protein NQ318_007050, partial [Aromia moschata]